MITKKDALLIIKKISDLGLEVGSSGNVSFRAGPDLIYITPTKVAHADVTKKNLSVVQLSTGKLIRGNKPSSDLSFHREIYSNRSDVHCIVHSHSHFATLCAILELSIPVLSTLHADYFKDSIPCLPFLNHRERNVGIQVLEKGVDTALLARHGSLLLIKNYREAPHRLEALEEVARLFYDALLVSDQKRQLPNEISEDDRCVIHKHF